MSADDHHGSRGASIRPADLTKDRTRALALTPVSRETLERLDRLVGLLLEWQQRINLIAPSTEPKIWTRHVADSPRTIREPAAASKRPARRPFSIVSADPFLASAAINWAVG